jgi:hypothetical protein
MGTLVQLSEDPARQRAFEFDHLMAHRTNLGAMSPLTRFSLVPYQLDPATNKPMWHLIHGQAHVDFTDTLPYWYYLVNPAYWPNEGVGIPSRQPLVDTDLENDEKRTWWTFVNHQEHLAAQNSASFVEWVFPFW